MSSEQHWAKQKERGNDFFLRITGLIVKYLPLWAIRFATFWVVLYFFLTSKKMRENIRRYQQRLVKTTKVKLPSYAVFRQFLAFGEAITDCFAVWQNKIRYDDLIVDDAENLYAEIDAEPKERGQLLICSHFGNIEICRALLNNGHHKNFQLSALVHSRNAEAFNKALVEAGANELPLIQVAELDAQKMLEIHQRIDRGEWIAIAADRIPVRGEKTKKIEFLGEQADFPQGPWLLASLLKAPVNTVFCLKENGRYRLKLRHFCPIIQGRGAQREQNIQQAMQQYARLLERECSENPLLWFNFYDFWNDNLTSD